MSSAKLTNVNSFNNYDDSKLETIPFSEFKDIKVLEDGVCGLIIKI